MKMDRTEVDKKAKEVKERMKAERVLKITKDLHEKGLLPPEKINSMEDDMLGWNNDQLEAMERFIDMAVDHAEMKIALQKARLELQAAQAPEGYSIKKSLNSVSDEEMKKAKEAIKDAAEKISADPAAKKMHEEFKSDYEKMVEKGKKAEQLAKAIIEESANEDILNKAVDELNQRKADFEKLDPKDIKFSEGMTEAMATDEATKLAHMMTRVGLIEESSLEQQVEEIKTWGPDALKSMWSMVEKATKPSNEPKVEARKWGAGSELAKAHHAHVKGVLEEAYKRTNREEEKEVVIDEPKYRKSIKEAIQEAEAKKSDSKRTISKPYTKRGSIKEMKEESDRKTVEEPKFITELREAREFLEKFDETFACAKVEALKAKDSMLQEEQKYDGTKKHEDTDVLRQLTKAHMKAQRDFAIIEKVYNQAFERFSKIDVKQASVEELEEALRNYRAGDEQTDIDALFGGKYKSGDDPYYKWLARKKKFISAEEAAELFTDMVSNFPSEVAGAFKKDKRSAGAVAPHTQGDLSPNKMY